MWNKGSLGAHKHSLLKLWIKTPISRVAAGSSFSARRKPTRVLIVSPPHSHQFKMRAFSAQFKDMEMLGGLMVRYHYFSGGRERD